VDQRLDIAVVEPDPSARTSLLDALSTHGISARAYASARATLDALESNALPRLVLFELDVAGESAFQAIRAMRARSRDVVVVALTRQDSDEWIFGGLVAGCVGYMLKDDADLEPAHAIEIAARGGAPMSDRVARRVVTRLHAPLDDTPSLSARERSVLAALADGASYEEAGTRLGISLSTVRTHIQRAYTKLGVSTKSEATMRAVRLGLLA
jgi:DNA-binding NarL/FixJ family response regulator